MTHDHRFPGAMRLPRAASATLLLCGAALLGACSVGEPASGAGGSGAVGGAGSSAISAGAAGQSGDGGGGFSSGGAGASTSGGMGEAGSSPSGASGSSGASGASGASGVAGAGGSGGGGGSGGSGGTEAPTCQGGKVVHFVYFVESDATFSESQRADVEEQAFAFQRYWFEQLGVTFYLNHPVVDVIMADHAADWYLTTPDGIHGDERWYRLGNVKKEVYRKLGIQDFDPSHRVVSYPTSRHDGRVGANFGGAWMDGDDLTCLGNGGFNYPYDAQNSAHCTGHVAHEFGHVLGLDHEGPNDDCMQYGFYTNDADDLCSFSDANVAKILADADNQGWFEAKPGETCVGK